MKKDYPPSVISNEKECYLCGDRNDLQIHHVYHGANRKKSTEYGAWVYLCRECHLGRVHNHRGIINWDQYLKYSCYGRVCAAHGWTDEDFRREFGKSYK